MSHLGNANKMVGEDHLPDASKMVSDTPRTDDQIGHAGSTMSAIRIDFARQLERELNAANDRIKRLEEACQRVEDAAYSVQDWSGTALGDALDELNKAKEAKP